MAQHTTLHTGKRRLAATQSARADTALGPGIPLHVATQQKQETGVERRVQTTGQKKKKAEAKDKEKKRSGSGSKRKRKRVEKGIRTLETAAPRRPGIERLP